MSRNARKRNEHAAAAYESENARAITLRTLSAEAGKRISSLPSFQNGRDGMVMFLLSLFSSFVF